MRNSDWAALIVPLQKVDSSVCLCGDYKLTVNLMCKVGSSQALTKIDLRQAYSQIPLDEESQKFPTVNMHMGLYWVTSLLFRVSAAVGIFLSGILRWLKGEAVYLDNI